MRQIIRSTLEQHLTELHPFNTVWEGLIEALPLPFQTVQLITATAETATISNTPKATETGFLQITLYYPLDQGTKAIEQRASDIRQHFFGHSWIEENVQIIVHNPPLVSSLIRQDNALVLPVTVYYTAYQL